MTFLNRFKEVYIPLTWLNNSINDLNIKPVKQKKFPKETSFERFDCCLFIKWNHNYLNRIHKGFAKTENELIQLFELQYHNSQFKHEKERQL